MRVSVRAGLAPLPLGASPWEEKPNAGGMRDMLRCEGFQNSYGGAGDAASRRPGRSRRLGAALFTPFPEVFQRGAC